MPVYTRAQGNTFLAWVVDELFRGRYRGFYFNGDADYDNNSLVGGSGNDTIIGAASVNKIFGHDGDDFIVGANYGINCLYGENNNDSIRGGQYGDVIDGGSGDDTLFGLGGNDTITGDIGNDQIEGDEGNDLIRDIGLDGEVSGGPGNDSISVNLAYGQIYGNEGNDTIGVTCYDPHGNIFVDDGEGNDTVILRSENISLNSSRGRDIYRFDRNYGCSIVYHDQRDSPNGAPDQIIGFLSQSTNNNVIHLGELPYDVDWHFARTHNREGDVNLVSTGAGTYDLWANCGRAGLLLIKFTESNLSNASIDLS